MDVEIIIQAIMGLVALLAILIFFLFLLPEKKDKKEQLTHEIGEKIEEVVETPIKKINTDLEHLRSIIRNKKSSTEELREALELVIKYHGNIHPKLGLRAHPDFDPYMDILFKICRHPNTDKDMIVNFDKDLVNLNPEYKKDIMEAVTKGLNSRRV